MLNPGFAHISAGAVPAGRASRLICVPISTDAGVGVRSRLRGGAAAILIQGISHE